MENTRKNNEAYQKPIMEIVELKGENVIVASCGNCGVADYGGYSMPMCPSDCTSYCSGDCEDAW